MKSNLPGSRRHEEGQVSLTFLIWVPILLMCMFVVVDIGNFLVMRAQARTLADATAVAAAGAIDVESFNANGEVVLNSNWGDARAGYVMASMNQTTQYQNMTFTLVGDGCVYVANKATCTVLATVTNIWGSFIGVEGYSTVVTSQARAATGISGETR